MSRLNKSINSRSYEKLEETRKKSINLSLEKSNSSQKLVKNKRKPLKNILSDLKPILHKPNNSHSISTQSLPKATKLEYSRKRVLSKLLPNCISHTQSTSTLPSSTLSPENKNRLKFVMDARDALVMHSKELTPYEQTEILNYSEIYYLGLKLNKFQPKMNQSNFGFDDNNGNLKLQKSDHIAYRYQVLSILGRGTFGQVFECLDHKTSTKVAIKIIRNKKRFFKQAGIEVSILTSLQENDLKDQKPVIKLKNYFLFRMHVCLTFDLWHLSLYDLTKLNHYKGLSLSLTRSFAQQILKGLDYLSSLNIIHCDLKPENILLKSGNKSEIGIIDFGSSTFFSEKIHLYIQSRFYRAPEIVLGIPYTTAIDMWSVGCILYELYTGQPLFPSEDEHELLLLIIEVLGYPKKSILEKSMKYDKFFVNDQLKDDVLNNGKKILPQSLSLRKMIKCENEDFIDLIEKLLEIDPEARITPSKALSHKWVVGQSRIKRQKKV